MSYESPDKNKNKILEDRNFLQINLAEYAVSKNKKSSNVSEDEIAKWLAENSRIFGDLFDQDPSIESEYEQVKDKNPEEFYDHILEKISMAKAHK